ncbi:FlgB family protein [Citreimonas salinaria]|uniref:Flagellar basal-body rod protein FlgB n=1 Tax=Citreimonas salinaria TaxID=321339 RepID=A0A1H3LRU5_9RHOB|nr:FlgB family protein [Citreimonas salinaria]SDY67083.1 flagellar basal-body rod protein FlgB [Citreimonas salinaria]
MFSNLDVFSTAMSMARHAGHKQALSAQNIANADTPGYRARDLPDFATTVQNRLMDQRATREAHMNGSRGSLVVAETRREAQDPNGNTVSLELEMIEAVEAKRQNDRAMAIYRNAMTLLRTAVSRT